MLLLRTGRSRWAVPWGGSALTGEARSDDELLLDAGDGDHQAFATLSDHVAGLVYANVRRALHDTTGADVVAEEALGAVWQQAAQFDPSQGPAMIWILDLAHRFATERDQQADAGVTGGPAAERGVARPAPRGPPICG